MKNLLTSEKNIDIPIASTILEFLSPSKVYLPISKEAKMLLKKKTVNRGSPLYQWNGKSFYSPISGNIQKIVVKKDFAQKDEMFLEIENNYKEDDFYRGAGETTTIMIKNVKQNITKNAELNSLFLKKKKRIVLNAIEDEIGASHLKVLFQEYREEILLFLDALGETYSISDIEIYFKESESSIIEIFESVIETYPNIKVKFLPNLYPLANETFFRKILKLEEDVVIFRSEDILEYYYDIVKERKKDFVFITITGDALKEGRILKVKKGTALNEVMEKLQLESSNYTLVVNSLMSGYMTQVQNVILNESIRILYFMQSVTMEEFPCIRCGKCIEVCPMKCNPYRFIKSKGKYPLGDCLHCGLCSFVCPSHIQMEKYLKEDENGKKDNHTL